MTTPPGQTDWVSLGRLVHLTVEGTDLGIVELARAGLLPARVRPTPAALAASHGGDVVLVDSQSTPLALARADQDAWTLQPLGAPATPGPLPERFSGAVVAVDGPIPESAPLPAGARLWLVPAGGDTRERQTLKQVRSLAADGDIVVRLPRPAGPGRWLLPARFPDADEVAQRLGARTVLHVGDHVASQRVDRGGSVVFLTGLSGSGKSTIAEALLTELERLTDRPLTLLDGDEVRRNLSTGLGFDKASREANIRRIGWVAALASRHGGIAVAAPIAPFASGRDEARRMAEEVGEFLLVWISTDLATCERRDRKGLYARARAGTVTEFTGISSPYERPIDADLVIDTARVDVDAGVALIIDELRRRGRLEPLRKDE